MRDASPLGHAAASAIGPSSPFPGAVLFDLDGTLVDSAGGIAWALDRTLEDLGHAAVGEALARTWIGEGARTLLRRALAHAGSPLPRDAPGFAQAFERLMHHYDASLPRQARAYPGAEQALRGLRARGIRVALCTNKPERFIGPLLETLSWRGLFDAVVGGDTLPEAKPSPQPLRHLAEGFALRPADCVMVGDSRTDADAARAAGMLLVLVDYGYHRGFDLGTAEAVAITPDLRSLLVGAPD